jgi:hypothetical protein
VQVDSVYEAEDVQQREVEVPRLRALGADIEVDVKAERSQGISKIRHRLSTDLA